MTRRMPSGGFSLVELLVGLAVMSLAMASVTGLLIHSSRINRAQQATAEMQASARICLSMIVERLRTAGWDPTDAGFAELALDPDPGDAVDTIELFSDLNEDGDTDDLDEAVLIRHIGERVEWRRTTSSPFEVLAVNVTNDADGDGTREPMFVPDSSGSPRRIGVRLTVRSSVRDLTSGEYLRYTIESDVAIRSAL